MEQLVYLELYSFFNPQDKRNMAVWILFDIDGRSVLIVICYLYLCAFQADLMARAFMLPARVAPLAAGNPRASQALIVEKNARE